MSYLDESVKRLLLAVVLQAIEDLRKDPCNEKLKAWLLSEGLFILESYDQPIDFDKWQRMIESGCQSNKA
jgi:hypothetical protein